MEKKAVWIAFLAIGTTGCAQLPPVAPPPSNPRIVERSLTPGSQQQVRPLASRKVSRSLLSQQDAAAASQQEIEKSSAVPDANAIVGTSRVEETPDEMLLPATPVASTTAGSTPAVKAEPAKPASPVPPAPVAKVAVVAPAPDRVKRTWVLNTSFHTLEEALNDFASQVEYEVVYEAREFPLDLKRNITLSTDADFWEALKLLGESYRHSDGAFQILPTKFKQIVVLPMGQSPDNQKGSQ